MTKDQLLEEFKKIQGIPQKTTLTGPHAIGDFFEMLMGKQIDNKSKADTDDGYEIKTKNVNSKTMTTLFTKEPTIEAKAKDILAEYGYDSKGKRRFNSTVNRKENKRGFAVERDDDAFYIKKDNSVVCGWSTDELKAKFEEKLPNMIYVEASRSGDYITYLSLSVLEGLDEEKLFDEMVVDFRMNETKNYGTAFRIKNKVSEYYREEKKY